MKKLIFGLILVILASCGNQNNSSKQVEFVWDFSEQKTFSYSYDHTIKSKNTMVKNESPKTADIIGTGDLNVRVKEHSLADLSLSNLKMGMITYDDHGKANDTLYNTAPTSVIQDMTPNGTFNTANHNIVFDLIFPLPSKTLKIGETNKIPMQMPFNVNGSSLFVKGFNTLTFAGMEHLDGKECAVLKGDINISNLEIPEELKGTYESSSIGTGTYYFDLENHYFVGADVQMTMKVLVDAETNDSNKFGMFANMESDNTFKIRLETIE